MHAKHHCTLYTIALNRFIPTHCPFKLWCIYSHLKNQTLSEHSVRKSLTIQYKIVPLIAYIVIIRYGIDALLGPYMSTLKCSRNVPCKLLFHTEYVIDQSLKCYVRMYIYLCLSRMVEIQPVSVC